MAATEAAAAISRLIAHACTGEVRVGATAQVRPRLRIRLGGNASAVCVSETLLRS